MSYKKGVANILILIVVLAVLGGGYVAVKNGMIGGKGVGFSTKNNDLAYLKQVGTEINIIYNGKEQEGFIDSSYGMSSKVALSSGHIGYLAKLVKDGPQYFFYDGKKIDEANDFAVSGDHYAYLKAKDSSSLFTGDYELFVDGKLATPSRPAGSTGYSRILLSGDKVSFTDVRGHWIYDGKDLSGEDVSGLSGSAQFVNGHTVFTKLGKDYKQHVIYDGVDKGLGSSPSISGDDLAYIKPDKLAEGKFASLGGDVVLNDKIIGKGTAVKTSNGHVMYVRIKDREELLKSDAGINKLLSASADLFYDDKVLESNVSLFGLDFGLSGDSYVYTKMTKALDMSKTLPMAEIYLNGQKVGDGINPVLSVE